MTTNDDLDVRVREEMEEIVARLARLECPDRRSGDCLLGGGTWWDARIQEGPGIKHERCQGTGRRFPMLSRECQSDFHREVRHSLVAHETKLKDEWCGNCHGDKRVPLDADAVHLETVHEAMHSVVISGLSFTSYRAQDIHSIDNAHQEGYDGRYWVEGMSSDLYPWFCGRTLLEVALRSMDAWVAGEER